MTEADREEFDLTRKTCEGDPKKCVGCRKCLRACPFGLPVFDAAGKSIRCDGCMACAEICPNGALRAVD